MQTYGWNGIYFSGLQVYEWVYFSLQKYINGVSVIFTQKVYEWVKCEKLYRNRYHFHYSKYSNGSCFSLNDL